jgi:hypothetical protein
MENILWLLLPIGIVVGFILGTNWYEKSIDKLFNQPSVDNTDINNPSNVD